MKIINNQSTDPFFNLALEEWLMKSREEEVFILWQNRPTVVIGRYQNAFAEVNLRYAAEKGINVVRRMSGGGAVYHDLGNINFTFIVKEDGGGIDFRRFLSPVTSALLTLGIEADISGRNDLLLNGKKISGSAQCRKYGKLLHHGTLLFDCDLETMSSVLTVSADKLESKGIPSVKSRVTSIKEQFPTLSVQTVKDALAAAFECEELVLTEEEIAEVKALSEKYSSWDYVYGNSKKLLKSASGRFGGGRLDISLSSENGIITDITLEGDFFADGDTDEMIRALLNVRLDPNELIKALDSCSCKLLGISSDDIARLILK